MLMFSAEFVGRMTPFNQQCIETATILGFALFSFSRIMNLQINVLVIRKSNLLNTVALKRLYKEQRAA